MFKTKKELNELKLRLEYTERRAGRNFDKLFNIDKLITESEKKNGNPYTLIREIKKELAKTFNQD